MFVLVGLKPFLKIEWIGDATVGNIQVRLVRGLLLDHLGEEIAKGIDVNTIDGFQGREKVTANIL